VSPSGGRHAAELPHHFEPDRWVPDPATLAGWRVSGLMRRHGIEDYGALLSRSVAEPEWFYRAAFEDLDLPWLEPWHTLYDDSEGEPWRRWFVGGRTNLVHLAVERWRRDAPDRAAVIWEGEAGELRELSYAELDVAVGRAARGLRTLGVAAGDVVALYLPMVPEAVVALLAAARLGAIAAPAFSGYGADALAERLRLAGAKMLVTADGYQRRGKAVDALSTARQARAEAPEVAHLVVVSRRNQRQEAPADGEVAWEALLPHDDDRPVPALASETPFLVAFTSGSTGRPKAAVHTHGGLPYRWAIDVAYGFDLRPGDRLTWVSDMGWIMGPLAVIGALTHGATLVLLEAFDYPAPERLWEQIDRHTINVLGLSPTIVRLLAQTDDDPWGNSDLASLRTIGTTGEPMTEAAWRWLHRHVGRGMVPIINATGGTEVGSALLIGSPVVTAPKCHFSGPAIGIDVDVVDAAGQPITDTVGELVVRHPWPSMTRGFWREAPGRYLDTYWSRLPGTWVHGDRAIRHSDGTWAVPGRSDDLIKVAGKRVGPLEFESLALDVDGIDGALAVGVPHALKGEVVVVLISGATSSTREITVAVEQRIIAGLGKAMAPAAVLAVTELPLLRSGKLHRRAARAWLSGHDPGDLSSLANPAAREALLAARERLTPDAAG